MMDKDHAHALSSLVHLPSSSFPLLQQALRHKSGPHAAKARTARTHKEMVGMAVEEGGGFSKMVSSVIGLVNPLHHKETVLNWRHSMQQRESMTAHDFDMAHLASQAYAETDQRKGRGEWSYLPGLSDLKHATWRHSSGNRYAMSIRGSKDAGDILPDVHIAAGTQDSSQDFQDTFARAQFLEASLPGQWDYVGHSLGGTKSMWVAQQMGGDSYAFNPGFHAAADDIIETNRDGSHVFLVKGDAVSNTIMARRHQQLKVLNSSTLDPLANHGMSNFLDE